MNENKHFLISNPKSIICIGLNYADHIAETSLTIHRSNLFYYYLCFIFTITLFMLRL